MVVRRGLRFLISHVRCFPAQVDQAKAVAAMEERRKKKARFSLLARPKSLRFA